MSREIKFRVWNIELSQYYHQTQVCGVVSKPFVLGDPIPWISFLQLAIENKGKYAVEQYTGLKDKNGRDIYEGDIARHYFPNDVSEPFDLVPSVQTVIYDSRKAMFCVDSKICGWPYLDKWEVIGNIRETPELLTKIL